MIRKGLDLKVQIVWVNNVQIGSLSKIQNKMKHKITDTLHFSSRA